MTAITNNRLNNVFIVLSEISFVLLAYFIIQNHNIQEKELLLIMLLVIFISTNIFLGFFLKLQEKLASENHINNTIFNLQKAIIIIRDGTFVTQVNDRFFQTFDFENVKDFTNKHTCVCELFVSKKSQPHLMPMMGDKSWTEYIIANPNMEHDVYMIDKYGNERIYSIDLRENIFGSKSMVVFTEITELKNQMETFHKLFDDSVDGLLILQDNHFLDVNNRLLVMIECSSKEKFLEFTPSSLLPLYQPDNRLSMDLHEEMVTECLRSGISSRQRLQRKLSGEEFWCEVAMIKIKVNHKDAIYVRWRDIHEYKLLEFSLEEQVAQQSQALITGSRLAAIGEMMENITHQWKQPLSVILNLVNILRLELPNNKDLAIIADQTKYLNNTIADFKNFSTSSEAEKNFFELSKSIETTLKMFQFQIEIHNIKIVAKLEENIMIKGDIGKFNQAILVILSNAKDSFLENREEERTIHLTTWKTNEHVYFTISDNAGGIPNEIIDKIFEPYFTTKFKDKGTGIGLSMTYNIIKKINGQISASNNSEGAVFKITLPKN